MEQNILLYFITNHEDKGKKTTENCKMFWPMKANMAFICWNWFLLGLILSKRKYKILIPDKSVTIFYATNLQEIWGFFNPSAGLVYLWAKVLLNLCTDFAKVWRYLEHTMLSCALYKEIPIQLFFENLCSFEHRILAILFEYR